MCLPFSLVAGAIRAYYPYLMLCNVKSTITYIMLLITGVQVVTNIHSN